jgi:hypothetical protein
VFVRERGSGRYLVAGWCWSDDRALALVLDEEAARALVARFACEPGAVELVEDEPAGADLAVA